MFFGLLYTSTRKWCCKHFNRYRFRYNYRCVFPRLACFLSKTVHNSVDNIPSGWLLIETRCQAGMHGHKLVPFRCYPISNFPCLVAMHCKRHHKIRKSNVHWPSPCFSTNWKALTRRSVSSTDRPTGRSLMVTWRTTPFGSIMNRPLSTRHTTSTNLMRQTFN